jgi:hypothetical protein
VQKEPQQNTEPKPLPQYPTDIDETQQNVEDEKDILDTEEGKKTVKKPSKANTKNCCS